MAYLPVRWLLIAAAVFAGGVLIAAPAPARPHHCHGYVAHSQDRLVAVRGIVVHSLRCRTARAMIRGSVTSHGLVTFGAARHGGYRCRSELPRSGRIRYRCDRDRYAFSFRVLRSGPARHP